MRTSRGTVALWVVFAALGAGVVVAISFVIGLRDLDRRVRAIERIEREVFEPYAELDSEFLSNGFGSFTLEFHRRSRLSDANIGRLLELNTVPAEGFHLIVEITTPSVTDESVPTLARLTTVDSLFVDKSGMTEQGVAKLEESLPPGTIGHYTWESK